MCSMREGISQPKIWIILQTFLIVTLVSSDQKIRDCNEIGTAEVTIKDGKVIGTTIAGVNDTRFCAFLGIPYAQPPVGHLRFRPPQAVKPWNGVLNATQQSNRCMQFSFPMDKEVTSEDCLYLNVFTQQLPVSNESPKPVVAFIHGGMFYKGSCDVSTYNPAYFINRGLVFVSFNYRLEAFGYLSTGDDEAPGNYGMKDQVAALKWIQENIHYFGGNPNDVTIFGQSAGAASVHYHMLSPLTKGLFHKAISNEGTVFMNWARNSNHKATAEKQARLVGCPTKPTSKMVSCLRELPATVIQDTFYLLFKFFILATPGFTPVVEKKTAKNPEPYLTHDPMELVKNGSFQRVPWLMGTNDQSVALFLAPLYNTDVLRDQLAENTDLWIKLLLDDVPEQDRRAYIWRKLQQFYGFNTFTLDMDFEEEMRFIKMASDHFVIHGVYKAALLHSLNGHRPIYKYNMAFRGRLSSTMLTTSKNYGVAHSDELIYLFKTGGAEIMPFTPSEKEMSELLVTLWTNFVKYGNPTPQNLSETEKNDLLQDFVWEPISYVDESNLQLRYLNIGQANSFVYPYVFFTPVPPVKLNMAVDLYKDRMDFWDSLPLEENFNCHTYRSVKSKGNIFQAQIILMFIILIITNVNTLYT